MSTSKREQPLISVIMSVYNEPRQWLTDSVESILSQTYKEFEFLIVIDNPENLDVISYLESVAKSDERVKLIFNESNIGLIASLNKLLSKTKGEFIARMDADDIAYPERLEKQLNYLKKHNLDLIGANAEFFKDDNTEPFYTTDKLITHKYLVALLKHGVSGIIHPTFFARAEVYEKLNGYSNALHAEDMEFIARAIANDFKVGNTSDVLLKYRYNDQSITKSNAFVVYKTTLYIKEVFNNWLKTGVYSFGGDYLEGLSLLEEEKNNFMKKQVLLGETRKAITNKNFLKAFYNIFCCFYYSSSTFFTIKTNLIIKLFKFLEKRKLGDK